MNAQHIITSFKNGVRKILFNRPEKRNAISKPMYKKLTNILNEDASDDKIIVTIITGSGDYYSSGNDIKSAFLDGLDFNLPRDLVQAFINYPKLLIAVVNGPAIGIAATTAALCDIVYASETAYFDTPFVQLGLCAEGASSYMFPRILGRSSASEMLFLNKKLSAKDAHRLGFVSQVIPSGQLHGFIESLYRFGSLPLNSVKINKNLIMDGLRDKLTRINENEIEALRKCAESEECIEAAMRFLSKKSKL